MVPCHYGCVITHYDKLSVNVLVATSVSSHGQSHTPLDVINRVMSSPDINIMGVVIGEIMMFKEILACLNIPISYFIHLPISLNFPHKFPHSL